MGKDALGEKKGKKCNYENKENKKKIEQKFFIKER
jgi:hypothetical protein